MDFAHEIGMRQLRILAGSITSLIAWKDLFLNYQVHCSLVSNTTNMYQYQYQVQRDWGTSTKYNRTGVPVPSTTRLGYQYKVHQDWCTSTKYNETGVPVQSTTRLVYQYQVHQDWFTGMENQLTHSAQWTFIIITSIIFYLFILFMLDRK